MPRMIKLTETKDISSVRNIFDNMDYGSVKENIDFAKSWREQNDSQVIKNIDSIIEKCENQSKHWENEKAAEKAKLLQNLASEIERHSTLLSQLELEARKVLVKDTISKSIPLLVDYLRYYARCTHYTAKLLSNYKPFGVCASYLDENTPLSIFGAILAPALTAGNVIIFGISATMIPAVNLIMQLSKNVGFPDGTISVVNLPNPHLLLSHERINKVTFVGNLFDKAIINNNITNEKNFTMLHLGKSSTIVFDSADIDSACDSIVESAWSNRGMFPCGIKNVYVQETIFDSFVNRIKSKLEKLKVEYPKNYQEKTCDIIIKNTTYKQNDMVEIINKIPLQIGHKNFGNNVIDAVNDSEILSILAFRTANEAVALANNTKFGLAIAIWSENISLVHEVTSKLKAGIIWVNINGYINANVSFCTYKSSGQGYYGSREGLLEYLTCKKINQFTATPISINKRMMIYYGGSFKKSVSGLTDLENEFPNKKDARNCVEIATKSFETWRKIQQSSRIECLLKLAEISASLNIKNFAIVEKWIEYLKEWTVHHYVNESPLLGISNPELKSIKEPLGVIVLEFYNNSIVTCLNLLCSALAYGNSVIIVNRSDEMCEFLENLCKIMSSCNIAAGAFNVFFNPNVEIINTLLAHREIQRYFLSFQANKDIKYIFKQLLNVQNIDNINNNVYQHFVKLVTNNKCIWTSVGESFL